MDKTGETIFFDSVSGKPLFIAPRGRTFEQFRRESESHGWPSFRDQEVVALISSNGNINVASRTVYMT